MAHRLVFEKLLSYDIGEPGISLQATLNLKEQSVGVTARLERVCLFERRYGEQLGFDIETGMRQVFGTKTPIEADRNHETARARADLRLRAEAKASNRSSHQKILRAIPK